MTRGLAAQRGVNGVNQLAGCVALAEGKDAVLCCLPHLSSRQTWHRVCLDVLRTLALVDVLSTCEAALQRRATACNHGTFKAQDETKAKQSKAKQSKAKQSDSFLSFRTHFASDFSLRRPIQKCSRLCSS